MYSANKENEEGTLSSDLISTQAESYFPVLTEKHNGISVCAKEATLGLRPDEQCRRPWGPSPSLSSCVWLREGEAPGLLVWFPPSHTLLGRVPWLCLLLGVQCQSAQGGLRGPVHLVPRGDRRVGQPCSRSVPSPLCTAVRLLNYACWVSVPPGACVLKMISPGLLPQRRVVITLDGHSSPSTRLAGSSWDALRNSRPKFLSVGAPYCHAA